MSKYLVFMSMGFEIAALIVGSVIIGNYFDEKYQTRGLISVGLIVISFIGWIARVLFLLAKFQKAEEKAEKTAPKTGL